MHSQVSKALNPACPAGSGGPSLLTPRGLGLQLCLRTNSSGLAQPCTHLPDTKKEEEEDLGAQSRSGEGEASDAELCQTKEEAAEM